MHPALWSILEKISRIESKIEDKLLATTQEVKGAVQVEKATSNQLVFNEQGTVKTVPNKTLKFTNRYQFTLNSDHSISLAHLRRGDKNPVKLLTFFATSAKHWAAQAPHFCGKDIYQASISITKCQKNLNETDQVILKWNIQGANKNARIHTLYY